MYLEPTKGWQRHQLATTERIQAEISWYTRPVIELMSISSLVYLLTWVPLVIFWDEQNMPLVLILLAAISACVSVMISPAFALAVSVERYFRRRL